MHWRQMTSPIQPDHDWVESDFQTLDDLLEEGRAPNLSQEDCTQREHDRLLAKFLRNPEVAAMDLVLAIECFLDRYPKFRLGAH